MNPQLSDIKGIADFMFYLWIAMWIDSEKLTKKVVINPRENNHLNI